ncbi:MAG: DUF3168 domain-containing protein [Ignavibacteriaceae bacterium]|nr:DUF3168 domain-containing protein [Ignavibacteriaceae bacterium]
MSVYSLLSADATVTAITTEIHVSQAPQGTLPPYVVIDFININPENLIDQAPGIESQYIGIDCIGTDQAESIELFIACRDALEPHGYMLATRIYGEEDKDTGYYRTLFDYSFWNDR